MAKIIIAPDSYKNALSAPAVAQALARGWKQAAGDDEILLMPMADGGEGTLDALAASCGGKRSSGTFTGFDRQKHTAQTLLLPDGITGLVELAQTAGIELAGPNPAPFGTTYGVGEQIRQLLDRNCRKIIVGLGGSVTTDGGAGLAQALGVRFYTRDNQELPPGIGGNDLQKIARVDLRKLDSRLKHTEVLMATDVRNFLTGQQGAARLFSPQKGASPTQVELLEQNLTHFSSILGDPGETPGDGAAGGAGYGLRVFIGGKQISGAELLLDLADFNRKLIGASLVITGEGRSDRQTVLGKLPSAVANRAERTKVPVFLVSGAVADIGILQQAFTAVFSISQGPGRLLDALHDTEKNLIAMGFALGRCFHLPRR